MSKRKRIPKESPETVPRPSGELNIVTLPLSPPVPLQTSTPAVDEALKSLGDSDRIKLEAASFIELFKSHNDSARSTFQILVTWYTFFITINVLAGGWFMSSLSKGEVISRWLLIPFASSFVLAGAMAIFMARRARNTFLYHAESAKTCLLHYGAVISCSPSTRDDLFRESLSISLGLYKAVPIGMAVTCACCAVCWITGTAYAMWIEAAKGPVATPGWVIQLLRLFGIQ